MLILTNENKPYDLNKIPDIVEDIRYCVLDVTDLKEVDYYFNPLIFLESFCSPAVVLEIGGYTVQMPLDWSIVVCDDVMSGLEIIPLHSLNDRGFHTVLFNPLNHMMPMPMEINIVNVYSELKWFFPKLRHGAILVVPVETKPVPLCALFVKERNKISDDLQISMLFE